MSDRLEDRKKINAILAMSANWIQDTGGSYKFRIDENEAVDALQSYIDSKELEARKEIYFRLTKHLDVYHWTADERQHITGGV